MKGVKGGGSDAFHINTQRLRKYSPQKSLLCLSQFIRECVGTIKLLKNLKCCHMIPQNPFFNTLMLFDEVILVLNQHFSMTII